MLVQLDDYDLEDFVARAETFPADRFGFVVTPNADHLLRLREDSEFRRLYAAAAYVLLDSRLVANLLRRFRAQRFPVCTGSDLTAALLERVVHPDDRLILIGASAAQADALRQRYGLRDLQHYNPPMGFIRDPVALAATVDFVEAHSPARFLFLAVGSPQQEMLADALLQRGRARGLAFCVGASVNFLTGGEKRAPAALQRIGAEWLYRLLQDPRRLWRRYIWNAPKVLATLRGSRFQLRPRMPDRR